MAVKNRIPFAEMQSRAHRLVPLLPDIEWHFGGSFRRRAETCADLDIVMVLPSADLRTLDLPTPVKGHAEGPRIIRGDYDLGGDTLTHVDIWACTPLEAGAFLWFITGPKDLNIAMRAEALASRLTLSQYGLFDPNGVRLDNGSEYSVAANMPNPRRWVGRLDAQSREIWNRPGIESTRVNVRGSKGDLYTVTIDRNGSQCTCKGFQYRGQCRHLEMAVSA